MPRLRLRGGHKVGALARPLTHHLSPQPPSIHQQDNVDGQYGNPLHPPLPPHGHTQPPPPPPPSHQQQQQQQQQPQHQQQQPQHQQPAANNNNNWGWGGESNDGSWNWGEGESSWSWNTNNQQQQYQQQLLNPKENYQHQQHPSSNQPHAFPPQHLPQSSQQSVVKSTESLPAINPAPSATPVQFQHEAAPVSTQQDYVNGSNQNGERAGDTNTDNWGSDNWGNDWSNADTPSNNQSTNVKQDNNPQQQQFVEHQQQQYNQYQQVSSQQQPQSQQQQQQQPQEQQHSQSHQHLHQQQQNLNQHQYDVKKQNYIVNQDNHHQQHQSESAPITTMSIKQPQHYHTVPSQTQTSTSNNPDDEWGWGNDDWQVNGQVLEQQSHQSGSQHSSESQPSPAPSWDMNSGTQVPSQDIHGIHTTQVASADGRTSWDYNANDSVSATLTTIGQAEERSAKVFKSTQATEEKHQQQQNYHQQQNQTQQNHLQQQQENNLQQQQSYQEQQQQHLTYEEQQKEYAKQHQLYVEQLAAYNAQQQQQHSQQPEENLQSPHHYDEHQTQEQQQLQQQPPQEQQQKYIDEQQSQVPAEGQHHQSQIHDYQFYCQEQQPQQMQQQEQQQLQMDHYSHHLEQQPQHPEGQVQYQQKPEEHMHTQQLEKQPVVPLYHENQQQQHYVHPEQEHHWDSDWGGADFDTTPAHTSTTTETTMAGHSTTVADITPEPIITASRTACKTTHGTVISATDSSEDHSISAAISHITEDSHNADGDNINEEKNKGNSDYGSYKEEQHHISKEKRVSTPQSQIQDICAPSSSSQHFDSDNITPATVLSSHSGISTETVSQLPTLSSSSLAMDNFDDGWDDKWGESDTPEEGIETHEESNPPTDDLKTNIEIPFQAKLVDRDNVSPAMQPNKLEKAVHTPGTDSSELYVDHKLEDTSVTDEYAAGTAWDDDWDQVDIAQSKMEDTLAENLDKLNIECSPNEPVSVTEIQKSGNPSHPQPSSNYLHQDGNSANSKQSEGYFSYPNDTSQVAQSGFYAAHPPQEFAGSGMESNIGVNVKDDDVGVDTPLNQHQPQDLPTQPPLSPSPREPLHEYSAPASQEPFNYVLPHQDPHLNNATYTAPPPQDHYSYNPTPQPQGVSGQRVTPAPPVPDPIVSRIPDGASSIPEMPTVPIPTASLSSAVPTVTGAVEVGSRSSMEGKRTDGLVSSQPPTVTSQPLPPPSHTPQPVPYPQRPPSSHTLPERPGSNQSAHSVHSIHSTHSAHSTLSQNQEVSIKEEREIPLTRASPARHQESPHVTNPGTGGIDSTAPPSNRLVGPPPVLGPNGAAPSLRARKGSPFQPPQSGQSSPSPTMVHSHSHQPQMFVPLQHETTAPPLNTSANPDMGTNLETVSDNIEQMEHQSGVSLWESGETVALNVKLAVAAPPSLKSQQPPMPSHNVPVVVPRMVKEEKMSPPPTSLLDPPTAHSANLQSYVTKPKVQSLTSMSTLSSSPGVLDLSKPARAAPALIDDSSQDDGEAPNFRRMVPGESSKGTSGQVAAYQGPALVPAMPSERVVTGNDNPHPVPPVRVKQEPGEVRSPPDGPATSDLSGAGAAVVPPIRSATIGSEEPKSRTFTSGNSGSRSDLTGDQRGGRWERDHSRDRSGGGYRDRSRDRGEGGGGRDYYRDDSPHSRHSYEREDRRRRWRESDDSDVSDTDRRYYDSSRDRRERAYRDELDRYSDRPIKEENDQSRDNRRDRDYRDRDRSKDYYRSYDDDPYYGRGDRSEPVSRSSSINNLDSEGERSTTHSHHHHHRSHYRDRDYYSSRDRERGRDGSYPRDYYQRGSGGGGASGGWDSRDSRRDPRYYGQRVLSEVQLIVTSLPRVPSDRHSQC
ncbi:hypothetical protein Pmani_009555 [Petrolisthes manimaculis]|uniref:Uncharacterized protein n=1 Tax=Petrolisthes manimaculis TaxID=1843537 RepID=A0AAE1UDI5_9EUCA|nr:hypothetical protein Pmani_009555 [Petrolisthes manimaculis]